MALTASQLATLKAAVIADATAGPLRSSGDAASLQAWCNGPGTGTIWRPAIPAAELNTAIVWSAFIALPVATQQGYFAMLQAGSIDATSANVRAGFSSIFSGQSLTNLTAIAQRVPTRFEALFTTSQVCSCFGQVVSAADAALLVN